MRSLACSRHRIGVSSADSTISAGAGVSVDLSSDASDGISIDGPTAGELEIGLPFAETAHDATVLDGVMVYDNGNRSSTTPLVNQDGSVQILTTIADASAPTAYEYQFDLAVAPPWQLLDKAEWTLLKRTEMSLDRSIDRGAVGH